MRSAKSCRITKSVVIRLQPTKMEVPKTTQPYDALDSKELIGTE